VTLTFTLSWLQDRRLSSLACLTKFFGLTGRDAWVALCAHLTHTDTDKEDHFCEKPKTLRWRAVES
jgi:hypothetical protein